jgi:hypothetical protein
MLQWLREKGCPWDEETCSSAAYSGNLEILTWARDNGCPWNKETTTGAANNGSLECFRYAVGNGCPWEPEICAQRAESSGNAKLRMWIEREAEALRGAGV